MVVALAFVKVAAKDYRNPQKKNLVSDLTEFLQFWSEVDSFSPRNNFGESPEHGGLWRQEGG